MRAKFEVRHGLDYRPVVAQGPKAVVPFLPTAQRHLLHQYDGKERLDRAVTELSQALALAMPHEDTQRQQRVSRRVRISTEESRRNFPMSSGNSTAVNRLSCSAVTFPRECVGLN